MKIFRSVLFCGFFLVSEFTYSQISFVLSHSLCAGDTVYVSANVNSFPATSFYWLVNPFGASIASATSQATSISFANAGTYTVILAGSVGNATSYATSTVLVYPRPVISMTASSPTICPGQSATVIATGADTYTWIPTPGFVIANGGTAFVSPGTVEVYSVSASNTAGCISSNSYTLGYGTFPNTAVVSSATAVCAGYSATLSAYGAYSYSWTSTSFTGSILQSSLTALPGTYSVIGSNGGSCSDTTIVVIGMQSPLNLQISSDRNVICKESGDTLVPISMTASGASTYVWEPYQPGFMTFSLGPTTSVSPSVSTCYTLSGNSPNCSGKAVFCIDVRQCVGIEQMSLHQTVSMFPNPVKNELTIFSNITEPVSFVLSDMIGKIYIQKKLDLSSQENTIIQLSDLPGGCYLVKITNNRDIMVIKRVVKE